MTVRDQDGFNKDFAPLIGKVVTDGGGKFLAGGGIAHFADLTKRAKVNTRQGAWLANRNYAAPEQRQKNGKVDDRADIYALGFILNEMFTGRIPLTHDYKPIESAAPKYKAIDPLVHDMIRDSPARRPTIAKIRSVLKAFMRRRHRSFKSGLQQRSKSGSARGLASRSSKPRNVA